MIGRGFVPDACRGVAWPVVGGPEPEGVCGPVFAADRCLAVMGRDLGGVVEDEC